MRSGPVGLAFHFDEENHIYQVAGGVEIPGCTRVIDTGGWDEYANVRQDILDRKSQIGREVHRCTLLMDRGRLDWNTVDRRVRPYVECWAAFVDQTKFVARLMEHRSICEVEGKLFGLTIDREGLTSIRGSKVRSTIVELKTTVARSDRHDIQTAGYAMGLHMTGVTTPLARFVSRRRLIVYLKPKGLPVIHECDDREDYRIFLHLLAVTHYKLKRGKMKRD